MEPVEGKPARRQLAGFSIFLDEVVDASGRTGRETRLYHAESGAEATLTGVSPERWIAWILAGTDAPTPEPGYGSLGPTATAEVTSVEILGVATTDADGESSSLHTLTARVVVQLTGVGPLEQAIGSRILHGLVESGIRTADRTHRAADRPGGPQVRGDP